MFKIAVHEAIGDLILLSATTPSYLHSIGLINSASSEYGKKSENKISNFPSNCIYVNLNWSFSNLFRYSCCCFLFQRGYNKLFDAKGV